MRVPAYSLPRTADADARDIERMVLGRRGVLRIGDHLPPSEVLILDLTREGCGIQGDCNVGPGMPVEVGIANVGRITATVLWCEPGQFGCVFDCPLQPGSVTAAFGSHNVLPFPSGVTPPVSPASTGKLTPRVRLLILFGTTISCWSAIGVAFAML
ncbi:hypothetical protein [Sphingomonas sp. ABOLG]|uniref:hypothetical protein n=1 Tax=Sphingomonas sp. ABOLG TaxID=1985880 RepID=UPI000F7DAC5E|nr:hypothetical protein [Sphingomonas sp. ABOLG]